MRLEIHKCVKLEKGSSQAYRNENPAKPIEMKKMEKVHDYPFHKNVFDVFLVDIMRITAHRRLAALKANSTQWVISNSLIIIIL